MKYGKLISTVGRLITMNRPEEDQPRRSSCVPVHRSNAEKMFSPTSASRDGSYLEAMRAWRERRHRARTCHQAIPGAMLLLPLRTDSPQMTFDTSTADFFGSGMLSAGPSGSKRAGRTARTVTPAAEGIMLGIAAIHSPLLRRPHNTSTATR